MCSQAVGGQENQSLDMASAWMWLAELVNLKPRVATTSTVLSSFLSVCGSALVKTYGQQARKLFRFLLTQYLPVIRGATVDNADSDGGATERLAQRLGDLANRQYFNNPEGFIGRSFWYS